MIPESAFGRVITSDLCRCCNSHFGAVYDQGLVRDHRFIAAALQAGFSLEDIWARFEGMQSTPDGRSIKTVVKDRRFRPQSQLQSLDTLAIASTDGNIDPRDLSNLRARLVTKVRAKGLPLAHDQIEAEIETLLNQVIRSPGQVAYNSIIGEGFRPSVLNPQLVVTRETRPWETDWTLAKIIYELSRTVVRRDYQSYFKDVFASVRLFIEKRESSDDGKMGRGYSRLLNLNRIILLTFILLRAE